MSDPGAAEIRHLLTGPDPTLERAARQLAHALPQGVAVRTTPHLRIVVDPELLHAMEHLSSAYRALRRRIEAVDTSRTSVKSQVLGALDQLAESFTLLVRSTYAASYATYEKLVDEAQTRQTHASAELQRALKELG